MAHSGNHETHLKCNRRYCARLRQRALFALGFMFEPLECPKCGEESEFPLEFAHQKPTGLSGNGRGLHRRYRDVIKNPKCYALRCKTCNAQEPKFHNCDEPPIPY